MQVVDLSHTISPGMPVYPGTAPPLFETPVSIEKDGFLEKKITFFSHTGTHVDAPAHMRVGGVTLDKMGIDRFVGEGMVVDITIGQYDIIEKETLLPLEGRLKKVDFVLLYSGWSKFWGSEAYFRDYPVLSEEAVVWISRYDLKGIGVDMISVDRVESPDMKNHHVLFEHEMIIIENLTNLDSIINKKFTFSCLPLKIDSGRWRSHPCSSHFKKIEVMFIFSFCE